MILTIDLRMIEASGIGTYLQNLIPLIIHHYSKTSFNLLGDRQQLSPYEWTHGKNIRIIECRAPIYSIAEQIELYRKIPRNTTLFWSPHYTIPILYQGKLLVTVHDVCHLAMPEYLSGIHQRWYAKLMFKILIYKANAILTVSQFTKSELMKFTNCKDEKIHPIHIGISQSWYDVKKQEKSLAKPFLLFVGNVKPHKNLVGLLKALTLLVDKVPHDLVIVGKKEGFINGDANVFELAKTLGDRVNFTGYVDDNTLKQYFVHADGLVFPSLYEGFGLPPLEAMACGCPVLVSNVASMPEVCGNAAVYFDPYRSEDIAEQILNLLSNEKLRDELRQKGLVRAQQFTWEKCADNVIAVIEEVLAQ